MDKVNLDDRAEIRECYESIINRFSDVSLQHTYYIYTLADVYADKLRDEIGVNPSDASGKKFCLALGVAFATAVHALGLLGGYMHAFQNVATEDDHTFFFLFIEENETSRLVIGVKFDFFGEKTIECFFHKGHIENEKKPSEGAIMPLSRNEIEEKPGDIGLRLAAIGHTLEKVVLSENKKREACQGIN